ncbi:MAG: flagellar P-ring protein [Gemmatales bacterium]|nr:MAG: flagellar P-ring protein [Gemmatales bacterium]
MRREFLILAKSAVWALLFPAVVSAAVRIKDITNIEGMRPNQLFGLGLVVGLEGTGGRSTYTNQIAVNLLTRFNTAPKIASGNRNDPVFRSGNVSVVMVTAELSPTARRGSRIDVTVSVIDDATSLQGGTLIMTPLRGVDGVDYAVAQGPVSIGGFVFTSPVQAQQPQSTVQKNHPTVGRIPGGAIVEREARGQFVHHGQLRLLLEEPDYNTAKAIAEAINAKYPFSAITLDAGAVHVMVPESKCADPVEFVAELGQLEVEPDTIARVVINERTGTIVAGENVRISSVAVAHGNLSIVTTESFTASQPAPFARQGTTAVLPQANVQVDEQGRPLFVVPKVVTVAELARALNALGATPRDLITIFQAIKRAGALHAELILI